MKKTEAALHNEKVSLKKVETKLIVNEEVLHGTPKESRLQELEARIPESEPVVPEEKPSVTRAATMTILKQVAKLKFEFEETPKVVKK